MTEDNFCGEVAAENTVPKSFPIGQKSLLEEILDYPQHFIPVLGGFSYLINKKMGQKYTAAYTGLVGAYHVSTSLLLLLEYLKSGS